MNCDAGTAVHATAVVIREDGVVIRGPSGAGKSTLALMLIEAARGRGAFARLVGDDRLILRARHGRLIAAPHPALAGLVERRTQPIAAVAHEAWCRVSLLIDLVPPQQPLPRLPDEDDAGATLAGVDGLPLLRLQGAPHALWCAIVFDKLAAA